MIFKYIHDYIYCRFNHLLSFWNQDILQLIKLTLHCNIIHLKGALLQNCFGFVNETVLPISCQTINQNIVYNGHKPVHGIKFLNLTLSNRPIGILSILCGKNAC